MDGHKSDCSIHNEPAMRAGPCDCGALQAARNRVVETAKFWLEKRRQQPLEEAILALLELESKE